MKKTIVSTEWLKLNLDNKNLIVLDTSPKSNVSGLKSELEYFRIKGSRYFDIKNNFSRKDTSLPNTLLDEIGFQEEVRSLGIDKDCEIVLYDDLGIYTSPRVWWMFKTMGHENVYVLNGGLPEWIKNDGETENVREINIEKGNFIARFQKDLYRNSEDIKLNLKNNKECVLDTRSEGRFNGTMAEPRKGLVGGHIPKSKNFPFEDVLEDGKFRSNKDLNEMFRKLELKEKPIIFSCGSGLTACINMLAASQVLNNKMSVYDGSWTEWAQLKDTQIEKSL